MTLQDLLDLLAQSGGSTAPTAAPATAASKPASPAAASGVPGLSSITSGTGIGNLVDPLFGINPGSASSEGGEIGGGIGLLTGLALAPETGGLSLLLDPLLGAFGGDILGGWFGGGLPTEAKPAGIASALGASGNPLDVLLGQYVNKGVSEGDSLSQSGNSTFEAAVARFGAMLEALTGTRAPGVTATGFNNNPSWNSPGLGKAIQGFQLPPGYEFINDPSALTDVYKDIASKIGMSAPFNIYGKGGQQDWQSIVQELIGQGALQKYQGPLGAAGAQNTSAGAIPNVSLPHPLAPNPALSVPPPYPV